MPGPWPCSASLRCLNALRYLVLSYVTRPTTIRAITEIPANTPRPIGSTESCWPGSWKFVALGEFWAAAFAELPEGELEFPLVDVGVPDDDTAVADAADVLEAGELEAAGLELAGLVAAELELAGLEAAGLELAGLESVEELGNAEDADTIVVPTTEAPIPLLERAVLLAP